VTAAEPALDQRQLLAAVQQLRGEVAATRLPLVLAGSEAAEGERDRLLKQLDDYVLPRLSALDAPLLAVVGGSTGAGKSTIVNSLVGEVVTRAGVLRPTTRASVLVHHPEDTRWFTDQRVLPGLARVTEPASEQGRRRAQEAAGTTEDPSSVRLVASEHLQPGLALLDAPDIDSVVRANRELARQLLSAADLWLFVTTAARYADAVPWGLLREAAERGTSVAIVLDRVPPEAMAEVRSHLAEMLREHGLAESPVFPVPETRLSREGLLPERDIARLHSWLTSLARDAKARSTVIRRTLTGALDSLPSRVTGIAEAVDGQVEALEALGAAAGTAYADALSEVERGMTDGTLLRGEVLARWQEFVGTGEFLRRVDAGVSRLRDRITALLKGAPPPSRNLGEALQSGAASLLTSEGQSAAAATVRHWRRLGGGAALVAAHPDLAQGSADLPDTIDRTVRDWQGYVLELVREEGKDKRTGARMLAFGVNGIAVVLMLVAFSQTGGLIGAEVGIAGGAAVLAQRLLEAVFGDQAVRSLAAKARTELIRRTGEVYAAERARFERLLDDVILDPEQPERLSAARAAVETAR
jgi:hypothetical protein